MKRTSSVSRAFFIFVAFAAVLCATPERAASQTPAPGAEQAREMFASGFTLWQAGDFPSAEQAFRRGLEIEPDNVAANFYMGDILKRRDDLAGARERFAIAVANGSTEPEAFRARTALSEMNGANPDGTVPSYGAYRARLPAETYAVIANSPWMGRLNSAVGWTVAQTARFEMLSSNGANVACVGANLLASNEDAARLASIEARTTYRRILDNNTVETAMDQDRAQCSGLGSRRPRTVSDFTVEPPQTRALNEFLQLGVGELLLASFTPPRSDQPGQRSWHERLRITESDPFLSPGSSIGISYSLRIETPPLSSTTIYAFDCRLVESTLSGSAAFPFSVARIHCEVVHSEGGSRTRRHAFSRDYCFILELGLNLCGLNLVQDGPGRWREERGASSGEQRTRISTLIIAPDTWRPQ
jgi:hypothetical protein